MVRVILSVGLLTVLSPSLCLADAAPMPRPGDNVPITITYVPDGERGRAQARLVIPKKFMVAAGNVEGVPMAQESSGRTLLTGLACSAALVTGGLWFMRRSGKSSRAFLALFIVCGMLSLSAFVPQLFGNGGRPPRILPKVEIDGKSAKTSIDIQIVADGDRIQLFLPSVLTPTEIELKTKEAPPKVSR